MLFIHKLRYALSEKPFLLKEAGAKDVLYSKIRDSIALLGDNEYRQELFHFHTRKHFISLNVMQVLNAVKRENNPVITEIANIVFSKFNYKPDANSYCIPMIKMNIRSFSILNPDSLAEKYAAMEIENKRMERQLSYFYNSIKKQDSSARFLDLVRDISNNPQMSISVV